MGINKSELSSTIQQNKGNADAATLEEIRKCNNCGGAGYVECSACGGGGTADASDDNQTGKCRSCNGLGISDCSSCHGLKRTTPTLFEELGLNRLVKIVVEGDDRPQNDPEVSNPVEPTFIGEGNDPY